MSLPWLILFATTSARATIYVAAYDPATHSIGIAYSSSGGHFWQTRVKGKGLIGAGAYGLCPSATPTEFLRDGDSASVIADKLNAQCREHHWEAFRLAIVTSDGAIETVIGKQGCTVENPECGARKTRDFAVVGGGLKKGVLDAAIEGWERLSPDSPLACRLYHALEAIYSTGGEKKDFIGASITVDDPARPDLQHWEARGAKPTLLRTLDNKMKREGVRCADN
jgi:hypothetical protein